MNTAELLKTWLLNDIGFRDYQVAVRRWPDPTKWQVVVYLVGNKLHFIIEDKFIVDCAYMRGGMATPISPENIIKCLFSYVDLRDPGSFEVMGNEIKRFV